MFRDPTPESGHYWDLFSVYTQQQFGNPTAAHKQSADQTAGRSVFLAPTLEKIPSAEP